MNKQSGKALKWIAIGCVGAFLALGGAIGGCVFLIIQATKPAVETTEKFLTAAADGKWADAKAISDATVGNGLEGFVKANPVAFGKTWKIQGRSVNSNNGVTTGEITVKLTGTDGKERDAKFTLRKEPDWKVIGFRIENLPAPAEAPPPVKPD